MGFIYAICVCVFIYDLCLSSMFKRGWGWLTSESFGLPQETRHRGQKICNYFNNMDMVVYGNRYNKELDTSYVLRSVDD